MSKQLTGMTLRENEDVTAGVTLRDTMVQQIV